MNTKILDDIVVRIKAKESNTSIKSIKQYDDNHIEIVAGTITMMDIDNIRPIINKHKFDWFITGTFGNSSDVLLLLHKHSKSLQPTDVSLSKGMSIDVNSLMSENPESTIIDNGGSFKKLNTWQPKGKPIPGASVGKGRSFRLDDVKSNEELFIFIKNRLIAHSSLNFKNAIFSYVNDVVTINMAAINNKDENVLHQVCQFGVFTLEYKISGNTITIPFTKHYFKS